MIFCQFLAITSHEKTIKISSSFTLSSLSTFWAAFQSFWAALKSFWATFGSASTLWSFLDKFCLKFFFESFCLVIFKVESSSLTSRLFSFFPSVSELSSLDPVLSGHAGFSLIFDFAGLRNRKFGFFLPLLIGLFTFFLFRHFVLLIFLPDVILFSFIPDSLLFLFFHVLVFNNVLHFVSSYFWKWVKFSFYVRIFCHRDVLWRIFKIFFERFLQFFI